MSMALFADTLRAESAAVWGSAYIRVEKPARSNRAQKSVNNLFTKPPRKITCAALPSLHYMGEVCEKMNIDFTDLEIFV